ncbi:formyltransferase family protein [Limnospira fusiformis]|uniref:formyltransferase family protein n=1 Tax=Limnospira fusiformis TaxID=54297 RepID=UPI001449B672|nr:formyl transferase [Limnospira fusiformis SAG 85.79]
MNIALFATDVVGYEIAKVFGEAHQPLSFLILDSKDKKRRNSDIIKVSGINDANKIIYSDLINNRETLERLNRMNLDLGILAWWPYIIKGDLLHIPSIGYLNFHPSYLPYNRGKDPNFWSIVEDTPFGVTLHFVNAEIDKGDIAFQKIIEKSWEDNGLSLYNKAITEIVQLFKDNFDLIMTGSIPRKKQNYQSGSFHRRSELDSASKIDLEANYKARDILNILRARTFPPHPAAYFFEDDYQYEVRIEIKQVKSKN